ncbi:MULTISPECIES: PepSY domain-containing protein [Pseudoalteromonas]|uniref:PepSY domain-containing protein n=1 Tax=Pseudoalteromonas obscura TaxID=3048491 RepID=A0ABT7ES20_9GAMM|nr:MULTISPECIES: PepSY domain-containing protein [Pseudoalteromonas]MBQ4835454.1 PepSY domain-containing protein [Pseudoalteromonas luteoviolacea]MDK2597866.1 PepSY domain-containing protein [Pseudoalteromonas sp. P94(2023)]
MQLPLCFAMFIFVCSLIFTQAHATPQDTISKKEAVQLATTKQPGKTLKISLEGDYFVVRILQSDGRIIDVKVHKVTGEVKKD